MGILSKLFNKNTSVKTNNDFTPSKDNISNINALTVHPDLENLLWIVDGPRKNYTIRDNKQSFEYNGVRISFSSFSSQEPSLLSVKLPIEKGVDPIKVERPPYYPTYIGLTDAQRGVYWDLLSSPYSGEHNIGYVFILYYGLERHLLEGDFEAAFKVILKLRDVYDNSSFQNYTACALILTCLSKQRADLALEFYNSLDKSYELNFSDNLYLLCKYGLNIRLTAADLIKMSKTFEFSNQNYIKKYPDLFLEKMCLTMIDNIGSDELDINNYISKSDWKKIRKQELSVFANVSISNQAVEIPLISENFKLKKTIFDLLEKTHECVKISLAQMRKEGKTPIGNISKTAKIIEKIAFDNIEEELLLKEYYNSKSILFNKHFALIGLQNFYYKYRDIDSKYLQICIDYCKEDINLLPKMQIDYIRKEKEKIMELSNIYSKKEINKLLSEVTVFKGDIPAFKRLAIIYDKNKDYSEAIEICNHAIKYYNDIEVYSTAAEFEKRKVKIEEKIVKLSK